MSSYQKRYLDRVLDDVFPQLPAVLIDGPKGVGKTMTAIQRAATVLRLDQPAVRQIASSDPDLLLSGDKPVLIDEWHLAEPIWGAVKRAVDSDLAGGQFLLTGSLPQSGTHSGAARITSLRMRPMTLPERGVVSPTIQLERLFEADPEIQGQSDLNLADYVEEILASGFPGIRQLTGTARTLALSGYVDRIVDSDVLEAGLKLRRPDALRRWLAAYAAAIGTSASWQTIRDAASRGGESPARSTTVPFIDALTRIRILDEIEPWSPRGTALQRLLVSPKHYLADPALGANLLGISADTALTHSSVGGLFENLVALSLQVFAEPIGSRVFHLRTSDGRHEVDFIIERPDGKVVAIESKLGSLVTESDQRHLHWLGEKLGDRLSAKVVVYTGTHAYQTESGVAVIPLALLC